MNHYPWDRLVGLARRAPADPMEAPPPGFVTRVAALGLAQRREPADFLGFFALRALGYALMLLALTAVVSYPLLNRGNSTAEDEDPVAEMVARL